MDGTTHTGRLARLWSDSVWPVLAGSVTAVGVLGASTMYGVLGLALITVGLWIFIGVVLYGTLSESGMSTRRAVSISWQATVVVVDLIGLMLLFPVAGWVAAAAVAVSSPPVTGWGARFLSRRRSTRTRCEAPCTAPDQALVDRAFADIVADLQEHPTWGTDGPA